MNVSAIFMALEILDDINLEQKKAAGKTEMHRKDRAGARKSLTKWGTDPEKMMSAKFV